MLAGAVLILFGVVGTAVYALKGNRRGREFSGRRVLIGWGLAFPIVTLLALMAFAFLRGEQLLGGSDAAERVIEVRAERWVWNFGYPEGVTTQHVLHVPAGTPFTLAITSEDIIHSVWIPRLGGKMDAIPGKINRLRLQADLPGTYRGTCAEFCGIGHAHMVFEVRAHAPADYTPALEAASTELLDQPPVLRQRPAPAGTVIERWGDYLLDWLGIT